MTTKAKTAAPVVCPGCNRDDRTELIPEAFGNPAAWWCNRCKDFTSRVEPGSWRPLAERIAPPAQKPAKGRKKKASIPEPPPPHEPPAPVGPPAPPPPELWRESRLQLILHPPQLWRALARHEVHRLGQLADKGGPTMLLGAVHKYATRLEEQLAEWWRQHMEGASLPWTPPVVAAPEPVEPAPVTRDWCSWSGGIPGLAAAAREWSHGQLMESLRRFTRPPGLSAEAEVVEAELERRRSLEEVADHVAPEPTPEPAAKPKRRKGKRPVAEANVPVAPVAAEPTLLEKYTGTFDERLEQLAHALLCPNGSALKRWDALLLFEPTDAQVLALARDCLKPGGPDTPNEGKSTPAEDPLYCWRTKPVEIWIDVDDWSGVPDLAGKKLADLCRRLFTRGGKTL